jgi:aromatic ring-opening dioxygenase catalytic subunit (LigB family)
MPDKQPSLFISHGGGPCFFIDEPPFNRAASASLAKYLEGVAATLPQRPKAVLIVSGHWEADKPTVNSGAHPPMLYDYYGFPPHTYKLKYPAPGAPALAGRVQALLGAAGIATAADDQRGFDHGVFVPMLLMFPAAKIPVLQLSLQKDLDAALHVAIGQALAPLRAEDVLMIGSGYSYHNMRGFRMSDEVASVRFDNWLNEAVTSPDAALRNQKLIDWESAPYARECQPREDHLIPLMVAAGAGGNDPGRRVYSDIILGKATSCFQFG